MTRKVKVAICVLVTCFMFIGISSGAEVKAPIKVGVLYTKTGLLAEHGRQADMGITMALEEINAKGGILGRKFETVWRDDQSKAEAATREANALLFEEKVDFLLGCMISSTCGAVSALVKDQKVPYICVGSQTRSLTEEQGHRYFFRALSNSGMTSKALILILKNRGFRSAWTITYDYAFGHQVVQDTKEIIKQAAPEIKVIGESYPPLTESDFTSYISQIVSAKPDVVIAYLFGAAQAAFVKQAKLYGFFDKIRLATDCNPENIRPIGLDFTKGVFGFAFYDITLDSPHNKEFVKKFLDKYKEYPAFSAASFYTGMISYAKAVQNAGKTDREAVINALEKITIPSPYGEINYRQCDHQPSFPVVVGETALKSDAKWYYLGTNTKTIPANQLWHSCEQVKTLREAASGKK